MTQALFSREDLARKPAHGQDCNRCGLCCRVSLCGLAQHVFKRSMRGSPGPCPALEHGDHGTQCGLIANTQHYVKSISKADAAVRATAARYLIGAGLGCTAVFNGEPRDEIFDRMITMRTLGGAMRAAMRAWGLVV